MNTDSTTMTAPGTTLTAADRCDASQAEQATTMFVKTGHHSLMFCAHHARKHGADLLSDGWYEASPSNAVQL
jgi:hypothetical protein